MRLVCASRDLLGAHALGTGPRSDQRGVAGLPPQLADTASGTSSALPYRLLKERPTGSLSWRLMVDDASAQELKRQQAVKENVEREGEAEADNDAEAAAHRRRAEKAAYLQEKLAEREHAEEDLRDKH
jgi:hypothetical protein